MFYVNEIHVVDSVMKWDPLKVTAVEKKTLSYFFDIYDNLTMSKS